MPATTQPLVTIVTPTHNRAALLPVTIDSVLSQDYQAIEYIVLDDGSTDDTPAVLERYGQRITAVRHPNMGENLTINRGWQMAHGDIIAALSDDDHLLPGAVRESVKALLEQPDVLAVYPDYAVIDGDSQLSGHVTTDEFDYPTMLRQLRGFAGPGAFFRRDVLDRVGFRDPRFPYAADCEFWLRVGLVGRMARVPRTLANYRVHPGSMSIRGPEKMVQEMLQLPDHIFGQPHFPAPLKHLKREAISNALALAGTMVHRRSYFTALAYYGRSFAIQPLAWGRWPPRAILGRVARLLMPHAVLAPPLAYWHRKEAEQVRRRASSRAAANQPG